MVRVILRMFLIELRRLSSATSFGHRDLVSERTITCDGRLGRFLIALFEVFDCGGQLGGNLIGQVVGSCENSSTSS